MKTLFAILIFLSLYVAYRIFLRIRLGLTVSKHYYYFERIYEATIEETQSKEYALISSLEAFKTCPILNELSEINHKQIAQILKSSPSPEKIIKSIVLKEDTKTSLKMLQNHELLKKMAAVGKHI